MSQPESPKEENQPKDHPLDDKYIQLQKEQQELQHQEACLHAWNSLQGDIHQLHQLFVDFNKIVDVNFLIYSDSLFCGSIVILYHIFFLGPKGAGQYSRRKRRINKCKCNRR